MGWRWSECYVLKTNLVSTNWLYIVQIKIKLKQVKELILVIRRLVGNFCTFAFPQTTILSLGASADWCHWYFVQINVASWQCWEQMTYYQYIQNISMQKIEGEGGGFCQRAENWRATTSMGPVGGGGVSGCEGYWPPRPLPSIGPSDHSYFLLLNKVLWILNLIFHRKRTPNSIQHSFSGLTLWGQVESFSIVMQ